MSKLKTDFTQNQLDQLAKLITLVEDDEGQLYIKHVLGSVWGSVCGEVGGSVGGNVWGSVKGDVCGEVVGNVLNKTER